MKKPWENPTYREIVAAALDGDQVSVSFRNGDVAQLSIAQLLPPDSVTVPIDSVSHDVFDIILHSRNEKFEVPWDLVRNQTDSTFSKFLAEKSSAHVQRLGAQIREFRKARGMTSTALADRSGLSKQTITRIELGYTDVSFATLSRILSALGLSLRDLAKANEVKVDEGLTFRRMLKTLQDLGVDRELIQTRIVPEKIMNSIDLNAPVHGNMLAQQAIDYIGEVLGLSHDVLVSNQPLTLSENPVQHAFYKRPASASFRQVLAYSHYAHYIARVAVKACGTIEERVDASDVKAFSRLLYKHPDEITLEKLVDVCWSLGIVVVPLRDRGVFHGACWLVDDTKVIVIKQGASYHSRWIFDLLHEAYHCLAHLNDSESSLVEFDEIGTLGPTDSIEEREANSFANTVLFGSDPESIIQDCVVSAGGKIERLKQSVAVTSKKHRVRMDSLANTLAFRLSKQGANWWSVAQNLQVAEPEPYVTCKENLLKRVDLRRLTSVEASLFSAAMK